MLTMKQLHQIHAFHSDALAYRASVPEASVVAMLNQQPVLKEHALKVLQALSTQTGRYYTFSNVDFVLQTDKMTLTELRKRHYFDIRELAWHSNVSDVVIYQMLVGEPVKRADAQMIASTLTTLIQIPVSLDQLAITFLDVPLQG